jgi:hypothetical protein
VQQLQHLTVQKEAHQAETIVAVMTVAEEIAEAVAVMVEHLVVKVEAAEAKQIVANAITAAVATTTIGIRRSNPTFSGNTPVQID